MIHGDAPWAVASLLHASVPSSYSCARSASCPLSSWVETASDAPVKDLLPVPPKSGEKKGPVISEDLARVPEVSFQGKSPEVAKDGKEIAPQSTLRDTAYQLAKINHLNARKTDGFMVALLENRRDIRAAEREVAATGLDVAVARANFFPKLTLTAGVGFEAFNPRYLFDPGAFVANTAGDLVAPLINKRAIQAEYLNANAKQLQAIYNYQRTVLNAFTEVVNGMTKAENYRKSVDIKLAQVQLSHARLSTTSDVYVHTNDDDLKKAAEALAGTVSKFLPTNVPTN